MIGLQSTFHKLLPVTVGVGRKTPPFDQIMGSRGAAVPGV